MVTNGYMISLLAKENFIVFKKQKGLLKSIRSPYFHDYKAISSDCLAVFRPMLFKLNVVPVAVFPEQKARATYDNILRMCDDPDVSNVIKFLRAREVVHFQRFGELLNILQAKIK